MVGEIGCHRQLAAIEGGVAQAGEPVGGLDLQGDEVAPGAGDNDFGGNDLEHDCSFGAGAQDVIEPGKSLSKTGLAVTKTAASTVCRKSGTARTPLSAVQHGDGP